MYKYDTSKLTPMVEKDKIAVVPISGKGRGVIATRFIAARETIEVCPVTPLNEEECRAIENTVIANSLFDWIDPTRPSSDESKPLLAIVHGFGMLYNHSQKPNADWDYDFLNRAIIFKALSPIQEGTEICYDYRIPLWFRQQE